MAVNTTWYDYPTNITGLNSLFDFSNDAVGGNMGIIILIAVFLISTLTLLRFGSVKAMASSSFLCSILSILLWRMQILSFSIVMITVGLVILMTILVRSESSQTI